jgi:ribonucleoside-diphosphate reductase alpha chain
MKVIKRNNELSSINIQEIRDAIVWACDGLQVNALELESKIDSIYNNETITTSQIQRSIIDIALKLTSVQEPEWRFVAARLLLFEFYKEIKYVRKLDSFGYPDYTSFVEAAVEKGLYDDAVLTYYTPDQLREASSWINPEYDRDFDYAGINMIITRFLIKDGNDPFEMPQHMFLTIALLLASVEQPARRMEKAEKIYHLVAGRKLSLATPIMINLRRRDGNLSSCFIMATDDNLDSIFYMVSQVARISKNGGGVGVYLSHVRATGAEIKGTPNASGGVIPWVRILNDTAVAVNQLGKRAGAVTVALDIWHLDIESFLELQTENGDQRKKAYDVFPQLVITDLFMKRVEQRGKWTLFDPHEVLLKTGIKLPELWGEDFEKEYSLLEEDPRITLRKEIDARDLFKDIMKTTIETGMPYLFFKDTVNRMNPNKHDGMIGCGNLCQESFSNFRPTGIGPVEIRNENLTQTHDSGLVHTCNLLSLNLANIEKSELEETCFYAVNILDNTIDLTTTPVPESNIHNQRYRTVGVGAMGLADYLARNGIPYERSADQVDELFEDIAYYSVQASAILAEKRGSFPLFEGSDWSKGIFFGKNQDWFEQNSEKPDRWHNLYELIKISGIRNSQLMAIAPNTSSALTQGCTASVLPVFSKFHIDKNSHGAVPICPPFIKEALWLYKENKHIDQRKVVEVISRIQKWIDQGISFELLFNLNNDIKAMDIYETLMSAWKNGCKTIYYTRSIQKNGDLMDAAKEECVSCAN